jgi:hypothetical protein
MRRMGISGLAAMAMAAASVGMVERVIVAEPEQRQRRKRAPQVQSSSLRYPDLNRSKKWKPETSYVAAAVTSTLLGTRKYPLR